MSNQEQEILHIVTLFKQGYNLENAIHYRKDLYDALFLYCQNSQDVAICCGLLGQLYILGYGCKKNKEHAAHLFHEGALKNDPCCMGELCECYAYGIGVKENNKLAIKYAKEAIKHNHPKGYKIYGFLLCLSSKKEDKKLGFEYLNKAMELGDISAAKMLKFVYKNHLLKRNEDFITDVIRCGKNAIRHQDYYGYVILGECYLNYYQKQEDEKYLQLAYENFTLAYQNTYTKAAIYLGDVYQIRQDFKKAYKLYCLAAKDHFRLALFRLGECYQYGLGINSNNKKAWDFYFASLSEDIPQSYYKCGECYRYGIGVKQDIDKASEYYLRSLKAGYDEKAYDIGVFFETIHDYKKSFQCFNQAILNSDYYIAYYKLGEYYRNGKGVHKNKKKAQYYYQLGITKDVDACYLGLGKLKYKNKEYDEAVRLFNEYGARNNDPEGALILGLVFANPKYKNHDYEKAINYFQYALKEGVVDAYVAIGDLYYEGKYYKKDLNQAISFYQKGYESGSSLAANRLKDIKK